MLNVRLYDDFKKMMENEGRNEEVLEIKNFLHKL